MLQNWPQSPAFSGSWEMSPQVPQFEAVYLRNATTDMNKISNNTCEYASKETGSENGILPQPLPCGSHYVHYDTIFFPQLDHLPIPIHLPASPCHITASVAVIDRGENMANFATLAPSHKWLWHCWDLNSLGTYLLTIGWMLSCCATQKPPGSFKHTLHSLGKRDVPKYKRCNLERTIPMTTNVPFIQSVAFSENVFTVFFTWWWQSERVSRSLQVFTVTLTQTSLPLRRELSGNQHVQGSIMNSECWIIWHRGEVIMAWG